MIKALYLFPDSCLNMHLILGLMIVLHTSTAFTSRILVVPQGTSCPSGKEAVTCGILENFTNSITNNTEVVFSPGKHYLNSDFNIQNKTNISLRGADDTATIQCTHHQPVSLHIERSSLISISNITINGCGRHGINDTDNVTYSSPSANYDKCTISTDLSKTYAAIFFDHVLNISISHVTVNNTNGYGVYMQNCYGYIKISFSQFLTSRGGQTYNGGNLYVSWHYCYDNEVQTRLEILNSDITYGLSSTNSFKYKIVTASGIHICSFCPATLVSINKCRVFGNYNGSLYIFMQSYASYQWRVLIENTNISNGIAYEGAGMQFTSWLNFHDYKRCNISSVGRNYFLINNSVFSNNSASNSGGAVKVTLTESDCKPSIMYLLNCDFTKNSVSLHHSSGAALHIMKYIIPRLKLVQTSKHQIIFKGVTFQNHNQLPLSLLYDAIVKVENNDNVKFEDCSFLNNHGTSLAIKDSSIQFSGTVIFKRNIAMNGGAMTISDFSSFFINANTTILFHDNRAKKTGGALYIQTYCIGQYEPCFFQPNVDRLTLISNLKTMYNMSLNFSNNSAGIAGNSIYGGNMEKCNTYQIFSLDNIHTGFEYSLQIFETIFHFESDILSKHVSSNPYKVILCDKNPTLNFNVIPGKVFSVLVKSAGQFNATTVGVVTAKLRNLSNDTALTPVGYFEPTRDCKNLSMIVNSTSFGKQYSAVLQVQQDKPESICSYRMTPRIRINIMPCPWGFNIDNTAGTCRCNYVTFYHTQIVCFLDDLIIQKPLRKNTWIGCRTSGSNCTDRSEFLYGICGQVSYCNQNYNVSASNTHHQCQTGRTGIACGSCRTNYSAVFGSSKCKRCTNSYLSLLPLYLIAPIILLILISKLNITIANGTVYGFLFYMGFLEIYKDILHYNSRGLKPYFLAVSYVISWLNLNAGIEVCFFNGMTTYHKMWLEFAFIFYIWILEALIVYLCRKYIGFTRMCGNRINKVLSTVLYMTILKCSKLTFQCFIFSNINFYKENENYRFKVWAPQTDIDFLSATHIPLVLLAIFLMAVFLAFVGALLFIRFLQRQSYMQVVRRLLPFFETFTGPCNDTHAFWPGLILLIQGLLNLLTSVYIFKDSNVRSMIGFMSLFILILSFLGPHGVYKKWSLNILESCHVLNLFVLTIWISFLRTGSYTLLLVSVIVSVACFVLHHCRSKVKLLASALKNCCWMIIRKCQKRIRKSHNNQLNPLLHVGNSPKSSSELNEASKLIN